MLLINFVFSCKFNLSYFHSFKNHRNLILGLNSVRREKVSSVTIVFYDKVRGRNKAQRWLLLVCCGFFIWKRYNRTHFHRTILWLTEEGYLLIENFVNIFFITSLSVSLHNLLDFYNLFCLCCIVMSRRYSLSSLVGRFP